MSGATSTGFANPLASQASDVELAVFIPELWSDAVRASFKKNLVLANVGTDLSALAANGGDNIHIPSVADVPNTVTKAPHVPFTYTNATEDKLTLALSDHSVTGVGGSFGDLSRSTSRFGGLSIVGSSSGSFSAGPRSVDCAVPNESSS